MYPIRKSRILFSPAYSRLNSLLIYCNEPTAQSMSGLVQRKFLACLVQDTLLTHCEYGRISYQKKKDKLAVITFRKDESVRKDDVYKSSVVTVCSGEPSNSISAAPARRKPRVAGSVPNGRSVRAVVSQATVCSSPTLCFLPLKLINHRYGMTRNLDQSDDLLLNLKRSLQEVHL